MVLWNKLSAFVVVIRRCKDSLAFVLTFLKNAGRIWTMSTKIKENKLIGQRLADIRQRETPAICIMQNNYMEGSGSATIK